MNSLFDSIEDDPPAIAPITPGEMVIAELTAQVARDVATLKLDDDEIHPDRAFYERRIADYRNEILRLRKSS